MKNKQHGFQAHSGYEDCKKCKKIINSVRITPYGEDNLWRVIDVVDNEDQGDFAYILLNPSQLSELKRKLNSMEEIK